MIYKYMQVFVNVCHIFNYINPVNLMLSGEKRQEGIG